MRSPLLCIFLLFYSTAVYCQENMGIEYSNYAPTNSLWLNPSSIADNKAFLDINIAGASAFIANNLAYVKGGMPYSASAFQSLSFNLDGNKKSLYVDAGIHGPSASLSIGDHGFALSTSLRNYQRAKKIPGELMDLLFKELEYQPEYGVKQSYNNISLNSLSWMEVGFSYAYLFKKFDREIWQGGITVKRMWGLASFSSIFNTIEYTLENPQVVTVHDFKSQFAMASGFGSGTGWGIDLGFTYKYTTDPVMSYTPHNRLCRKMDYYHKIGVSLLDWGSIKFTKNALLNTIDISEEAHTESSTEGLDENDVISSLQNNNFDNTTNSFKAKLPLAISIQYDYNFGYNIYFNATAIHPLRGVGKIGIQRPPLFAFTPRYERKRIEVSLPITLWDYKYPSVGFAVRLNSIIIGTDRLIPYVLPVDTYRADIYFNLKITIFDRKKCRPTRPRRATDKVRCPSYH